MFRTRSDYIKAKDRSYTDIRNQLHRAYQKKGANARIRFVEGRGLYIKNEKADWRKSFDSDDDKNERQAKFESAKEQLKEAINREYDGWKVDGISMGQHVVNNLTMPPDGDGLDEKALKDIDALIAEGMKSAAADLGQTAQDQSPRRVSASKEARGRIQEARARNDIFEELKSAQDQEASRNWAQRWWARHFGDNHEQLAVDRAFERARNWRALVHGNRLLSEAIAEDLKASGYPGDPQTAADDMLKDLGLLRSGLTPKGRDEVLGYLIAKGYAASNVQELGAYADLTQNAKINIDRLRRLNGGIDQLNRTVDFGAANNDIIIALNASDDALKEAASDLSAGRLSQVHHIENLYEELRKSFRRLCEARQSLGSTRTPKNAQALDRITALIDEHLAVTHDLASAVLKVNKDNVENHDENFRLPIESDVDVILSVDANPLIAGLPRPQTLFQSTARKTNGEAMPEADYNKKCQRALNAFNSYKRTVSGPRTDEKLKYLGKLRRRVDEASRLNDQCVITSARQGALGGSAHASVNNHLHAQRGALHVLKLISAQEQLRLEEELAGRGRRRDLNPSETNSSTENRRQGKFVSPPPGRRGVYRYDESNDDVPDSSSTDTFSNNAGGNESLSYLQHQSQSSGLSNENQYTTKLTINTDARRSHRRGIATQANKAASPAESVLMADFVINPGSNVETQGAESPVTWNRKEASDTSFKNVTIPKSGRFNYISDKHGSDLSGALRYDGGHLRGGTTIEVKRPLDRALQDTQQRLAMSRGANSKNLPHLDIGPSAGASNMSQVSADTADGDLRDQMRTGFTRTYSELSDGPGDSDEENNVLRPDQVRTNKKGAGRRFDADIKDDGLQELYDGSDYTSGDESASGSDTEVSSLSDAPLPETRPTSRRPARSATPASDAAQYASSGRDDASTNSGSSSGN